MNGHPALKTHSFEVKMAFSIEEAPCGSPGFFTSSSYLKINRITQKSSPLVNRYRFEFLAPCCATKWYQQRAKSMK